MTYNPPKNGSLREATLGLSKSDSRQDQGANRKATSRHAGANCEAREL